MKKGLYTRILSTLMVILTLGSVLAGCGAPSGSSPTSPDSADSGGTITIGVTGCLTGNQPLAGESTRNATNLFAEQVNAEGGILGKDLVIQFEDDMYTSQGAINAVNKLTANPEVSAIVGLMLTQLTLSTEGIVHEKEVPLLSMGTAESITNLKNPYIFRIRLADTMACNLALDFLGKELQTTKMGIIWVNNDYTQAARDMAVEYCESNQIDYVLDGATAGAKDFTS